MKVEVDVQAELKKIQEFVIELKKKDVELQILELNCDPGRLYFLATPEIQLYFVVKKIREGINIISNLWEQFISET